MGVIQGSEALFERLRYWRRYLHAHPELSFEEFETAKFIASELEQIDALKVETNIGGNGVVATLSSGVGPVIGIRADMDALPIQEENIHDFISNHEGVMHACGHDAHIAMLLGAVHLLTDKFERGELEGTVKFIFQPAEESTDAYGLSGAPYMMKDGVLDDVDWVIALHVCPWHPVGVIQMNHGFSMANVDVFQATIRGSGGHGGYPHLGTDPLWMLSNILPTFYGIAGRRVSPLDVVAASIGRIESGTASNIIPTEVYVEGTLRSYSPTAREALAAEVENVFKLAENFGGMTEFYLERGEPALNNDAEVNLLLEQAIKNIYPELTIHWSPYGMGGEDFGYMTEAIPGAMFFLGCSLEDGIDRDLHTSVFDIDEACLPIGTAVFVEAASRFLTQEHDKQHPVRQNSNTNEKGA